MIELNNIYQGDCFDLMKELPDKSVDMILCDLPYGNTNNDWDKPISLEELWKHYWRIIKDNGAIVLTAQQPFATDLINSCRKYFRYEIIWQKTQKGGFLNAKKMPLRSHENILVFYKKLPTYNPQKSQTGKGTGRIRGCVRGDTSTNYSYHKNENYQYIDDGSRYPDSVINIPNWNGTLFGNTSKSVIHPTQKPVPLFRYLIETYTNPGEIVLDNCAGSGTTAVACIETGRQFVVMEKNENHFLNAKIRIANAKLQKDFSLGL